jgi:hypothetical protein
MGQTVDTRVIKKFKHRVQVCSAADVVVDGKLEFSQKFIYDGWAMINPRRTSTFSPEGHTVFEEKDRRTHFIHMRYNPQVVITTSAWIYEKRLKSPPRWFKILFAGDEFEDSRYFKFDCRLMEAGDDILEPVSDQKFLGVPEGLKF